MSFREKSAWIVFTTVLIVFGSYSSVSKIFDSKLGAKARNVKYLLLARATSVHACAFAKGG
ncbi:MAG: hypothetical protein AAFQ67_07085, partial [Pseudomonadota bacterium]